MRRLLWVFLLAVLLPLAATAQETRGNINGIVQDSGGVIPGAAVRITNTDTSQTQQLVTNSSGYFEAVLLNPGTYAVRVELQGYKTLTPDRHLARRRADRESDLDAGGRSAHRAGHRGGRGAAARHDDRVVRARTSIGAWSRGCRCSRTCRSCCRASRRASRRPRPTCRTSSRATWKARRTPPAARSAPGSGFDSRNTGNNYTIDGASNNGFGRRIASSPNSDQIEEMRIETSNFDASQGHGTGLTVSMMTRGGTNTLRGSANYTHWNNQLNSPNLQQKVTFAQDPRQEDAFRAGRSHIGAFTLGGPIVIPKVVNGRGKAFFFANYSKSNDSAPGRLAGNSTVPANRKHLEGDFSDLLLLPSGAGATTPAGHHQYQIFDPLTTRPDPLRPGRVIRDPFPSNIIPKDRFMNAGRLATRTRRSGSTRRWCRRRTRTSSRRRSSRRTTTSARRNPTSRTTSRPACASTTTTRTTPGSSFAANGNKFLESSLVDWTYDSPDPQFRGLHDVARARYSWSVTGTWTRVLERHHGHRHADLRQPRLSARHAQEPGQLHADVGGPAVVHGRLLPGAVRVHPAAEQHQLRLPGHGRHGRRRHLGHDLPGAVEPDEHARVAHLARRRGRAVGAAHQPATAPGTWGRSTTTTPTPARPTPRTCSRRSRSA